MRSSSVHVASCINWIIALLIILFILVLASSSTTSASEPNARNVRRSRSAVAFHFAKQHYRNKQRRRSPLILPQQLPPLSAALSLYMHKKVLLFSISSSGTSNHVGEEGKTGGSNAITAATDTSPSPSASVSATSQADPLKEAKVQRKAMARQRRRIQQQQQEQSTDNHGQINLRGGMSPSPSGEDEQEVDSNSLDQAREGGRPSRMIPSQVLLRSKPSLGTGGSAIGSSRRRKQGEDEGDDVIVYQSSPSSSVSRMPNTAAAAATSSSADSDSGRFVRVKDNKTKKVLIESTAAAGGGAGGANKTRSVNTSGIIDSGGISRQKQEQEGRLERLRRRRRDGDLPNVLWRAISWEDLRQHPCFDPLPHPSELFVASSGGSTTGGTSRSSSIKQPQDLSLFRQDSWEWDALHQGRLTTSRVGGMLGFYEVQAASILRVPRSLISTSRASIARAHLLEARPACYVAFIQALQDAYYNHSSSSSRHQHPNPTISPPPSPLWRPHRARNSTMAQNYLYEYTPPPPSARGASSSLRRQYGGVGSIRMTWGSTQEASSILAALNYFGIQGGARVKEAGMYPLEAIYPTLQDLIEAYPSLASPLSSMMEEIEENHREKAEEGIDRGIAYNGYDMNLLLPPMGASPDGVIVWPDGTIEALEAKNHSPYRENYSMNAKKRRTRRKNTTTRDGSPKEGDGRYLISDQGPHTVIGAWHVAQLYWHMLCLGPSCRSAVFCSASATKGVVLIRLHRDDVYLAQMLKWMIKFVHRYLPTPRLRRSDSKSSSSKSGCSNSRGGQQQPKLRSLDVDFFFTGPKTLKHEKAEYKAFLQETLRQAQSAELIVHLSNQEVQRSPYNEAFFLDEEEEEDEL